MLDATLADVISFNAAISAFERSGQWQKAGCRVGHLKSELLVSPLIPIVVPYRIPCIAFVWSSDYRSFSGV